MEFVEKFAVILGQSAWSKTSEKKRKNNAIWGRYKYEAMTLKTTLKTSPSDEWTSNTL